MGSKGKRYSPKFKFNVVLEALKSPEKSDAEVARAFEWLARSSAYPLRFAGS